MCVRLRQTLNCDSCRRNMHASCTCESARQQWDSHCYQIIEQKNNGRVLHRCYCLLLTSQGDKQYLARVPAPACFTSASRGLGNELQPVKSHKHAIILTGPLFENVIHFYLCRKQFSNVRILHHKSVEKPYVFFLFSVSLCSSFHISYCYSSSAW